MFQWRVLNGDYRGHLGIALAHPLYIAMGRLALHVPIGTFPGRLNFLSGLGMALALANLAAVVATLTGRRWAGALTAAMLAVAHTPWWLGTVAEVYTFSVAAFTAEVWLLVLLLRRPGWPYLVALGLVNGLHLSLHNFALLGLAVYVVVALWLLRRRRLGAWALAGGAAAFLLGAAPWIGLIVRQGAQTQQWVAAVHSALFGRYAPSVLNTSFHWRYMKVNAALAAMNMVSPLPVLAVVGWGVIARRFPRRIAAALLALTGIELAFVIRYPVPDQFTFLLPSLAMIALAGGVGMGHLAGRSSRLRIVVICASIVSVCFQPAFYAAAPWLAKTMGVRVRRIRQLPFRDEARYYLVPWKQNETSAQRFAEAALSQAEAPAVILADHTSIHPLWLVQELQQLGTDVQAEICGPAFVRYGRDLSAFRRALAGRNVYAVAPSPGNFPDQVLQGADFEPLPGGVLQRVRWKEP